MHAPILVGHGIAPDRPVQPRIDGVGDGRLPHRIPAVPGRRTGKRFGQSRRIVDGERVGHVLGWLVEAAAFERTSRMREIEALAVVRVVAVGLAVVHRGIEGENRFLAPVRLESAPHLVEAGFEGIRSAGDDAVEDHDGGRVLMHVDEHAPLVGPGRPLGHATRLPVARRRRQQADGRVEVRDDLGPHRGGASRRAGVVRFPEIERVSLGVVRDVAPHPPQFEVEMRAEEYGFTRDSR